MGAVGAWERVGREGVRGEGAVDTGIILFLYCGLGSLNNKLTKLFQYLMYAYTLGLG